MLDKKKKEKIIAKYKTHEGDTGSSQVQVAILTEEIKDLTKHLKDHKKDFSSRRGLLRKVAERRRLLSYLQREDQKEFEKLIKSLKIKVPKTADTAVAPVALVAEQVEQEVATVEDEVEAEN